MSMDSLSFLQFLAASAALLGFLGIFVSWCFAKQVPDSAYNEEKTTADFSKLEYYHPVGRVINRLGIALWGLGLWGYLVVGGRQSHMEGIFAPSSLLLFVLAIGIIELLVAVFFMRRSRDTDEVAGKVSDYFTFQGWRLVRIGVLKTVASILGIWLIRL